MWHLQSPKNGMFVPFEKRQENQISLSYQILPLVLKLLLRPMLGELGFQVTTTEKSDKKITKMICKWNLHIFPFITTLVLKFQGLLPLNSWIPSMTRWAREWERHALNEEMRCHEKVRWKIYVIWFADVLVLAVWSAWISVHFICQWSFQNFGAWQSFSAVDREKFKKWLIPRSSSIQPHLQWPILGESWWRHMT